MDSYGHLIQEDRCRMEEDHYLSSDRGNLTELSDHRKEGRPPHPAPKEGYGFNPGDFMPNI